MRRFGKRGTFQNVHKYLSSKVDARPEVRYAVSPIDGKSHPVVEVMEHPQFKGLDIVECSSTHVQFTDPWPTEKDLAHVYDIDYNAAYGRDLSQNAVIPPFVTRRAAAQVALIARNISPETKLETVVEVGAGWGALSGHMMECGSPFPEIASTFELDSEAVEFMRGKGIDAHHGRLDDCTIERFGPGMVDLVCSSMMLEHVPMPQEALRAWGERIKVGGHLFIEVPLENPVPNWWGNDPAHPYWVGHITFFRAGQLETMVESVGFEIVESSLFDHPLAAVVTMPGQDRIEIDDVPVAMDDTISAEPYPKLCRLLARKIQ
eukprot:CAMPEP_0185747768 /NCGR_PEP_ID=MMETSP1174-20130828/6404_1 /TAXON_ID=35687 /ORGANISM="Dictyocha speculum, Strain CCMP1381" /LENGTH=318 /DNA_ID=CAMNT_0028423101 /DNA_START=77 /DNA_END=1033 /DNA_ORIENTATION=-